MSAAFALVFARCAGFTFRAPGFAHPDVPPPVRAALAYALAFALVPSVRAPRDGLPGALVLGVALEFALGAAVGTAAALLYDGAYAGGRALDDYVGVRGSVPNAGVAPASGFGRLWSLAFVCAFFTGGGDAIALRAFAHTLETLPPGTLLGARDLETFAVTLPATLARAALLVAAPAAAAALTVQFALAVLARVVPRLATFPLSFGATIAAALAASVLALPLLWPAGARPWIDLSALHAR